MSYDERMREVLLADAMRRGDRHFDDATMAAILNYYGGTTTVGGSGEPSDKNRVHRAHDTSRTLRRIKPLSGDWADIESGASKVDHVKVMREGEAAHHLPTTAYRKARKARAPREANEAAAEMQARADAKAALLASVQVIGNID